MSIAFRNLLHSKKILWGTLVSLPAPEITEILADAGYDWLFIDMEHAPLEVRDVQRILQAGGESIAGIIRLPANDPIYIKKAMDIGPAGIMLPLVNSADDARNAVKWSKYPPMGTRSVGVGRVHRYGAALQQTIETANDTTAVIVQVEHIQAVENIDGIVAVPGVDAVLIGPYDLSASMGIPGQVADPRVKDAIEKVRLACQKTGMPLGIFTASVPFARECAKNGFTLIAVSTDTLMLVDASRKLLQDLNA
jgi:2-dehydro-3-deoxyglucarate aldolase